MGLSSIYEKERVVKFLKEGDARVPISSVKEKNSKTPKKMKKVTTMMRNTTRKKNLKIVFKIQSSLSKLLK